MFENKFKVCRNIMILALLLDMLSVRRVASLRCDTFYGVRERRTPNSVTCTARAVEKTVEAMEDLFENVPKLHNGTYVCLKSIVIRKRNGMYLETKGCVYCEMDACSLQVQKTADKFEVDVCEICNTADCNLAGFLGSTWNIILGALLSLHLTNTCVH
ncbi:uncharacterized protein LOC115626398 [Scaptodrosophila lebanonensis]|uniref:Uncharacterized protein LOC115626398 n=1 Tax=Drosophila lebanonensis TaxID=7225 RepID=A0A6J2TM29_DROLE|nr:uncharacterized protein LOC115626398 [Scaptodrosophila lebanonensis]